MDINDDEEGRRSYAKSIQEREADILSVDLIDAVRKGSELGREHAQEVRRRLRELGVNENSSDEALVKFAELRQLHELDEPFIRTEVEKFVNELRVAAVNLGYSQIPHITVSSIPSGTVNAMCAPDPFDGSVHVFADAELLIFCQMIGKLVASCMVPVKDGDVLLGYALHSSKGVLRAALDADLRSRVSDLYVALVFVGRARAAKPFIPESDAIPASVLLTRYMELFAIAHELGHVAAMHLAVDQISADQSGVFDIFQEFEADELAVKLLAETKSPSGTEIFCKVAPYVFLKAASLLEECQKVFGSGTIRSMSHPVSSDRLERVKAGTLNAERDEMAKYFVNLIIGNVDAIFQAWSSPLISLFEYLKKEGYSPEGGRTPYRQSQKRPDILG